MNQFLLSYFIAGGAFCVGAFLFGFGNAVPAFGDLEKQLEEAKHGGESMGVIHAVAAVSIFPLHLTPSQP